MTRHVLLCSANDPLVTSLRLGSGQATFRVTVCRRGMEAVQSLLALSFDGLILDLETPGLESLFVISIARRIDPTLPVVAISTRPVGPVRDVQQKGVVCHLVSTDSRLELARMIPLRAEDLGAAQHEDVLMYLSTGLDLMALHDVDQLAVSEHRDGWRRGRITDEIAARY